MTKKQTTPEVLAAVANLQNALNKVEALGLINDDKAADLFSDTLYELDLKEDEDGSILAPFWQKVEEAGLI